jgi:non-ribosomal peptide synthetase component F
LIDSFDTCLGWIVCLLFIYIYTQAIPIGLPVWGTEAVILPPASNTEGQEENEQGEGELGLGGLGLARGYHNRPELTAERCVGVGLFGVYICVLT